MSLLKLKDNSKRFILQKGGENAIGGSPNDYAMLDNVANRTLGELLNDKRNNLLVFPHSFKDMEDISEDLPIMSLKKHYDSNHVCDEVMIETGNIAGFIGVGGISISISSRFSTGDEDDFFLHYLLSKVLSLNVVNMKHSITTESIFDFYGYLFTRMLNDAMTQGLYKEYRFNKYNDANIKGAIDVSRHIKMNIPFQGKVAYNCREFSYDNRISQLIRHTIEFLKLKKTIAPIFNDGTTRDNVARINLTTPSYNCRERQRVMNDNLRILHHPYFSKYTALQKLCMVILRHEKLKYGNDSNQVYGILFDVSWLWEEYLNTIFCKEGFIHPQNKKGSNPIYLAATQDDRNKIIRYPDFYDKEDGGVVIDAKYKNVPHITSSRDDIHQMIAYMYRLKSKHGVFVRPKKEDSDSGFEQEVFNLQGYGEDYAALYDLKLPIPSKSESFDVFRKSMQKLENTVSGFINLKRNQK